MMGMAISLKNEYMREEGKSVDEAAEDILSKMQQDYISELRYDGRPIDLLVDGTYSVRGHKSPDGFVRSSNYIIWSI